MKNCFQKKKKSSCSRSATKKTGTTLLIVDGQIDFHPGGSLPVPCADEDEKRIAALIRSSITDIDNPQIDRIVATMDSHYKLHIANPGFWVSKETGEHPDPFTAITCEDVKAGKWRPRDDLDQSLLKKLVFPGIMHVKKSDLYDSEGNLDIQAYCIRYTEMLEKSGKFQLMIWPEHCLIDTKGHNISPGIKQAMDEWSDATGRSVEYILKGQNILTEMYSAFRAEVAISPDTSLNTKLLDSLMKSDKILVCGQALTHCVNHTARDLIDYMKGSESKVQILKDCSSSIPGFEKDGQLFLEYITSKGGKVHIDYKHALGE